MKSVKAYWCLSGLIWNLGISLIYANPTGTAFSLDSFKFNSPNSPPPPPPQDSNTGFIFIGVLVSVGTLAFILMWINRHRDRDRLIQATMDKANLRLEVLLSNLGLSSKARETLIAIAGTPRAELLLPLAESNLLFEEKASQYKKKHQDGKDYNAVYLLRKELGFEFINRRTPLICTQMLAYDLKMECQIPHTSKRILFVTPILDVNESRILIRPPTLHNKPVNLKRFPYLLCKIHRNEDADYSFTLDIISQVTGKFNAVILGHSNQVRKLFTREFERVAVSIHLPFYILKDSPIEDSPKIIPSSKLEIQGQLVDISIGGVKLRATAIPEEIAVGDLAAFHLKGANLREDLVGKIVNLQRYEKEAYCNVQFTHLSELVRSKINRYLFNLKKQQPSN